MSEIIQSAPELRSLAAGIFRACGAPDAEAAIVADELVETNLLGIDSHGVLRIPQYVNEVLNGQIKPGAPVAVMKETPSTAVVDCGHNFGQVSGARMTDIALAKAEDAHVVCVVSKRSQHVGRLGAYVHKLAEHGMVGLAFANCPKGAHLVAPWGGRQGRLATNPLAYAAPTRGNPIVFDMATSMVPEGKLRLLRNQGRAAQPGWILDSEGRPTTDPNAFYAKGSILPFGSELGYKGFGLGLLVEILGSVLAGEALSDDSDYTNGFCLMAVNPDAFCGRETFADLTESLAQYIASCPTAPGFDRVMLPGAPDYERKREREANGIPIDGETWSRILEAGRRVGCDL